MPELPEVESIKLQLQKYLVGHKIEDVLRNIHATKIFSGNPHDVIGARVKDVRRFAKVLSIDLSNGYSMVIHIKLTGQLIYRGPNLKNYPSISKKVTGGIGGVHTHIKFNLDKNGTLYYNDLRRFGWIKIVKTKDVETSDFIGKLGPEPFKGLSFKVFKDIVSKFSRPIKVVLMDQEKIGGVGNIYANDALWLAKIDPKRPSSSLNLQEQKSLYKAVHEVLKEGIKYGGSSELSYVRPDGTEGKYQRHTLAYGKEGTLCHRCKKEKFEKYFLSGRGTYVCPTCQR